jgi:hypothetical protein
MKKIVRKATRRWKVTKKAAKKVTKKSTPKPVPASKLKPVELTLSGITRDSEKYIQEWVTFHHLVGFDRFILYLHICQDKTEQKLIELKEKLGIDIVIHHCKTTDKKVQMGCYKHAIETHGDTTEWLMFLDDDEYIYNTQPTVKYPDDIKRYLRVVGKNTTAVSVNAKVFGPSRHIAIPDYRLSAYTERLSHNSLANKAVKTFIRPSQFLNVVSPHYQMTKSPPVRFDGRPFRLVDGWRSYEEPMWSPICFNHYYTESLESWLLRYRRGSCNDPRRREAYSIDEFMSHTVNMEYDNTIQVYCNWHLALLDKLK